MKNKIYYLKSCSTCQRILKELELPKDYILQNIKEEPITNIQLKEMYKLSGSFEALFSRRSQQFRKRGLHEQNLTENDYEKLILEEYTFLKRPVMLIEGKIFIGNAKKIVSEALENIKR